jgi:hypothetical protein
MAHTFAKLNTLIVPSSSQESRKIRQSTGSELMQLSPGNGCPLTPVHILTALVMLAAAGCGSESSTPFEPESPVLGDPPLDRAQFFAEVLPVLSQRGCAAAQCHASGHHPFPLSGGSDPELDYFRAADQVSLEDPASSPLLLKPLAYSAGGLLHDAPTIFTSTADPDYQVLARWVGIEEEGGPGSGAGGVASRELKEFQR